MKKLLYISTAAIALGVGASAAHAEDPVKLSLSGYITQWYGYIGNEPGVSHNYTGGPSPTVLFQHGDAALAFAGSTKLDSGLTVGATIQLNGSPANQENNSYGLHGNNAVEFSYFTVSGAFGTFNGGTKYSLEHDMHQDAPEEGWLFVQDGIWGGPWVGSPIAGLKGFIAGARSERTALYDELSTAQIQYVSPTYMGFSLGVDFVPNQASVNSDGGTFNASSNNPLDGNFVTGGKPAGHGVLAYTNTFGDLSVNADLDYGTEQISSVGFAPAGTATFGTLNAYSGGLSLGYKGFTLGGSIMDRDAKSGNVGGAFLGGQPVPWKNVQGDGVVWDIGLGYENGPWGVSADYLKGSTKDGAYAGSGIAANATSLLFNDDVQFYEVGAHYNLGPGIRESLNVFRVNYKVTDGSPIDKNSGTGATLNTTINF